MKKKFVCIKQHDSSDCGAACLASIAWYYNLRQPLSVIRGFASTDARGTNVLGIVQAAEKLGFAAKGVRGNQQALADIVLPAIAHLAHENRMQHFVVVYAATRTHITIADPALGISRVPLDEFLKIWTGVLILLSPSPNFVPGVFKESNLHRLYTLIKPYPSLLYESILSAVVYTLLGFSTTLYIQYLIDYVFPDSNRQLLNALSIAMIALLGFRTFFGWSRQLLLLHLSQKIDASLILGYYKHLLKLPQFFFDTRRVGEIISRVNDAVKIRVALSSVTLTIVVDGMIIVCAFGLMFVYAWKLALAAVLILPAFLALYWGLAGHIKKTQREIMERSSELQAHMVSSVNGASTIKIFQTEAINNLITELSFVKTLRAVWRSGMQSLINVNGSELISGLALVLLLWMGGGLVIDGECSIGELMSFYTLIVFVTGPAGRMIGVSQTMQDALIAADRLFDIMALETEEMCHTGKLRLRDLSFDSIEFVNVSFRYGTRAMVLNGATFSIAMGKMTAIVGESGSGKSTIVKLLQGLYPLKEGDIRFGGVSVHDIELNDLRAYSSAVPQEIELFHGTIVTNVACGEIEPNYQRVAEACALSGADKFICHLPDSWNSLIGEHGTNLSGGERQRLALARALYRLPKLLILDEATSSLDSESERIIQQVLRQLLDQGTTVIAIAHRLSTIMDADKIIVVDKGKIIEEGTHVTLLQRDSKYRSLWSRQIPFALTQ
jgi:ATP-binding cassette, subfamily C, bacteriocin exporter